MEKIIIATRKSFKSGKPAPKSTLFEGILNGMPRWVIFFFEKKDILPDIYYKYFPAVTALTGFFFLVLATHSATGNLLAFALIAYGVVAYFLRVKRSMRW